MTAPYTPPADDELRQQLLESTSPTASTQATPGGAPLAGSDPAAAGGVLPTGAPIVPPPPPAPPDAGALMDQTTQFASQFMSEPNRYLSPLATATRETGEARLRESAQQAERDIGEWAQSRGLLGSSYEGEQQTRLAGEMQRARGEQERGILEMLATAEAMDRDAALRGGLETVQMQERAGLDRYGALLDSLGLRESQRQFDVSQGQQESQFARTLAESQALRLQQYGISQQDLDLRAQALQQEAQLAGRGLDLQEARDQAEVEFRAEQLMQQATLEGRALDINEARYLAENEIMRDQLAQEQQQFTTRMAEQVASRLQDQSQFASALEVEQARDAMEAGLRERALDLQETGMTADIAYRQAALDQEAQLAADALELQRYGIDEETSYRYAALMQDATLEQEALRLQERGLDIEQAWREADQLAQLRRLDIEQQAIELRAEEIRQGDRSLDLQEARDMAQIQLAREEMSFQMDLLTTEIAQRESEFARAYSLDERQFVEQSRQFATQMQEQVASRLQQDSQFQATLQQADTQFAIESGLREQALVLQERGMELENAYQYAALEQQERIVDRQMVLERELHDEELSYRYAVLEQDAGFRTRALELQEQGMTMEEAYRQADVELRRDALAQQGDQFTQEMDFRIRQAENDQDRFDAMMELWREYFGDDAGSGGVDNTIINVYGDNNPYGGTGDTGGTIDYPNIPPDNGGGWYWDGTINNYVDSEGNEYNE